MCANGADAAKPEARFEELLKEIRQGMPDEESANQIESGFRKSWDKPPLAELEMILRRTLNLREARLLIFFPEPVDMRSYCALIAGGPRGAPDDHPQNKVRRPFLALLYMRHVRSWALMREFVREGGFVALAALFDDPSPYLRAQAIDTFMQLTSTELHDWFVEPTLEPAVHRRLIDLASPEVNFVRQLQANMGSATSFPGGSFYCLQILAFWLSALRYFYCEQRVLRLGTNLMEVLVTWAGLADLPEDERELAVKLRDDFQRFPTVDAMHGQLVGAAGLPSAQPSSEGGEGEGGSRIEEVEMEEAEEGEEGLVLDGVTFFPSPTFTGAKPGYVYKSGEQGAGYYRDPKAARRKKRPASANGAAAEATEALAKAVDQMDTSDRQTEAERVPIRADAAPPLPTPPRPATAPSPAPAPAAAKPAAAKPPAAKPAAAKEAKPAPAKEAKPAAEWMELKKLGNAAFASGSHKAAAEKYTQALSAGPPASEAHLLLSNRSAAHLKLATAAVDTIKAAAPTATIATASSEYIQGAAAEHDKYAECAAADAREALALQPRFAKASYRLASALIALRKPAAAVGVLEEAIQLATPGAAKDELRAHIKTAQAAVEAMRKEELRAAKETLANAGIVHGQLRPPPAKAVSGKPAPKAARVDFEKAAAVAAAAAKTAEAAAAEAAAGGAAGQVAAAIEPPPSNAQQFERGWETVRKSGSLNAQVAWLERLPARDYEGVFKESLSEGLVGSLLSCVREALGSNADGRADFALQLLSGLSSTRRFSLMPMMFDKKQKALVQDVFNAVRKAGGAPPDALLRAWEAK